MPNSDFNVSKSVIVRIFSTTTVVSLSKFLPSTLPKFSLLLVVVVSFDSSYLIIPKTQITAATKIATKPNIYLTVLFIIFSLNSPNYLFSLTSNVGT